MSQPRRISDEPRARVESPGSPGSPGSPAVQGASPWPLRWVVGTLACVFGPYLVGGIRTEQLALYGSAVVALVFFRREVLRALPTGWLVLALWAAYAATAAVGGIFFESSLDVGSGSLVAGLDNAILPLATMTVAGVWTRLLPVPVLLRVTSWVVVGAMAINGALALLTSFVGVDSLPLLPRFWAAGGSGITVAELAGQLGRYSGIFNQPAEAGVAYCLAAFCLIYLMRSGTGVPRRVWVAAWVLIIVGGLMTLSKVYVLGGVLISAVLILTRRPHRASLSASAVVTVLVMSALGAVGWLGTWGASGMFGWYVLSVRAGDSWAYTLSAGRFGSSGEEHAGMGMGGSGTDDLSQPGGLMELGHAVLKDHPWFGLGADGAAVSYDSTWIEAIIVAGSVGAALLVAVHVVLLVRWIRLRSSLSREEWRLAAAVVILAWGSSFGMPSLTGNRESSLMWILLSLLIVFRATAHEKPRSGDEEQPSP